MLTRWLLVARRTLRRLGIRVLAFAVVALGVAFLAPFLDPLLPQSLKSRLDPDAVLPILTILASSMLAVTTFSLGVMVSSYRAAAQNATPRAYRIVTEDRVTQNVLATFTGAFLFSLSAIVMFRAGYYTEGASVVVFGLTVLTIVAIILAILRWIDHLSKLGSMDRTLDLIESAARTPLDLFAQAQGMGAVYVDGNTPFSGQDICAPHAGYVQFINLPALQGCLESHGASLRILARPGDYVVKGMPLARVSATDQAMADVIEASFTLALRRTLDQDVRFALIVLNEIGLRALSPGINDPGTAIEVTHRMTGLLHGLGRPKSDKARCPRVEIVPVSAADLVQDGFASLILAAAQMPDVSGRLLDAFDMLDTSPWPEMQQAARAARDDLLHSAEFAGMDDRALQRLRDKASRHG